MAGYVYLIGSRTFGWYKIGKARRAEVRLKQLGVLLPFKIEVLALWRSEAYHSLEAVLHERFKSHRLNGEWFSFESDQVDALLREFAYLSQSQTAVKFTNLDEDRVVGRLKVKRDGSVKNKTETKKFHGIFKAAMDSYLASKGLEPNKENNKAARKAVMEEIQARKKVLYFEKVS